MQQEPNPSEQPINQEFTPNDRSGYSKTVVAIACLATGLVLGAPIGFVVGRSPTGGRTPGSASTGPAQTATGASRQASGKGSSTDNSYAPNVEIMSVSARPCDMGDGRKGAWVNLKVRNNGDRTITEMRATIYCLDAAGTVIHEDDIILASLDTASGEPYWDYRPIKPSYIRVHQNGIVSDVPPEWRVGSVRAAIKSVTVD